MKIWTVALQLFDQMSERTLKQDWFGDGDDSMSQCRFIGSHVVIVTD